MGKGVSKKGSSAYVGKNLTATFRNFDPLRKLFTFFPANFFLKKLTFFGNLEIHSGNILICFRKHFYIIYY